MVDSQSESTYSVWIAGSIWDDRWNESIRRGLEDPSCDAAAVQAFAGGRGRCKLSEAHQRVSSLLRQQSRIRGRSCHEKLMFHIGRNTSLKEPSEDAVVDFSDEVAVPSTETTVCGGSDEQQATSRCLSAMTQAAVTNAASTPVVESLIQLLPYAQRQYH